ncbi:MBL fold metallo-hydrolase [Desulfogranum japonicum]|uniref:MBL fold metallo-hydrolase n=1 Tax=Desulfogranum japonicum TaxID=231447 RepID=UPI000491C11F|nr:MBL fold metallo-hydrolase [Desulfogranum japonicum]
MGDEIKITLIANAGVLVEHKGVGLLVDGIHHEEGHLFSKVTRDDLQHMQQGTGVFTHLDYLLFTHEHPDHFTPGHVLQHIRSRAVKGIILPGESQGSAELRKLYSQARKRYIPVWSFDVKPGSTKQVHLADGLHVTGIGARHMGPQYASVQNSCFLLTWAGRNLLFTGDADHVTEYFQDALDEVSLDAVFVNPLFYHNPIGQEIIQDIFCPKAVVIYHMPFEQDDTLPFSYMVESDMKRYAHHSRSTHVFREKKQIFIL